MGGGPQGPPPSFVFPTKPWRAAQGPAADKRVITALLL